MSRNRNTPWRRVVAAYDVLRGRPPKADYGLLIVLPLAASAGGALIGLGLDMALSRHSAGRRGSVDTHRVTGPQPVPSAGRRDV
jgi:hypothetical protein